MIDSGVANLGSVMAAFARADIRARAVTTSAALAGASHVVLPGVGAAGPAMARLKAAGFDRAIPTLTVPVLGICLGMQLLFEQSAEGEVACLGVIAGQITRFAPSPHARVPHMGWNELVAGTAHPLIAGFGAKPYAYFVHSYRAPLGTATLMQCEHGVGFSAVVAQANFYGAQFHPERSAAVGRRLLENFVGLA